MEIKSLFASFTRSSSSYFYFLYSVAVNAVETKKNAYNFKFYGQ